ncbi:MAG TPA: DUF5916 domain-containing protein [Saprospiraceae bacterium]|nr:DUF5916 domain-containing protein [Saprospiraceae bacterium]
MFKKKIIYFFISFMISHGLAGGDGIKTIMATKINESIKIDGQLDDVSWSFSQVASRFVQLSPSPGSPATFDTEVRFLYDDEAIYIGAKMYDNEPYLIQKELYARDGGGNADWFSVTIDTYQDGSNGFQFIVSAAGVQSDVKYSVNGRDRNWDAIWDSQVKIVQDGWIVEMKIPLAMLRFPNKDQQMWSIQFGREIKRLREESYWNEINPRLNGFLNQAGKVVGIKEIKTPVRFSLTPFVTGYLNTTLNPGSDNNVFNAGTAYTAGMDLKYGINDAFTLDMTLVPDFGQTISDNQVLNLTPFEIQFQENRQFFTEGTELFNKGDLFYSRRIGGQPINYSSAYRGLHEGERVISNPDIAGLYNATKISGRNSNGLGMGFLNAVAKREFAIIEAEDGSRREIETNPLTNYNIMVLDQNLPNNSFVSVINTNVTRFNDDYNANVSGASFQIKNKNQSYSTSGKINISQLYHSDFDDIGHEVNMSLNKISGQWQGSLSYLEQSDNYNINDFGFLRRANERTIRSSFSFNQFQPKGKLLSYRVYSNIQYSRLYDPDVFNRFSVYFGSYFQTEDRFSFGLSSYIVPISTHDYFEPRTSDYSAFYALPASVLFNPWISTDYRKKLALDFRMYYRVYDEQEMSDLTIRFSPRMRVNDKFSISPSSSLTFNHSQPGFISKNLLTEWPEDLHSNDIMFGQRDRTIVENSLSGKYIFTNKMSLVFRMRHYWDHVVYNNYAKLEMDGSLNSLNISGLNGKSEPIFDRNLNLFNVDMDYIWRFAPGSDIIFNWKNQIVSHHNDMNGNYFDNLQQTLSTIQGNNVSVKVVYWLDYNQMTNKV